MAPAIPFGDSGCKGFEIDMGIKERHVRDRETVQRAILDAARDLFVAEGFHHVSIRKIAERIEYSPAAIYGYFPSKDDIFFALAEEGFRLLCDRGAVPGADANRTPLEHVRGVFRRLYEFSRDHPQYFALMFVDRTVPRIGREYERFAFAHQMKQNIVGSIAACVECGELPDSVEPATAMRVLTSGVIGVAVMQLSGRLPAGENADLLAADVLNTTIAGLQSGVPLHHVAMACPLDEQKLESEPRQEQLESWRVGGLER
jgi:AcrR family transcriptional regulator